ncbi:hypothetical protein DFJ73DRAFT_836717 [Zopfochytrium polystomum]|nr:hypothetical protein DFJ73DRAFT_836717 [Zopfochytrium polystomum]
MRTGEILKSAAMHESSKGPPPPGPYMRRLSSAFMGAIAASPRSSLGVASMPIQTFSKDRRRSVSSELKRVHPLIKWIRATTQALLDMKSTRIILTIVADQRFEILSWMALMILAHGAVTTLLVLSLSTTMPGIWVYNFVQLYVIVFVLLSNIAGRKISQVVRLSITASDLLRGTIKLEELKDYWTNGKKSPAHSVSVASSAVEFFAEMIIVACSILFSWEAVPSHVVTGNCTPPDYANSTLSEHIDLKQFLQGDVDFASIYNLGLPLADGLIGGWAGWPLDTTGDSFSIASEGPVYVIQVMCDDGFPRSDIETDEGTTLLTKVLMSDEHSMMLETTIRMPPGSVFDDSKEAVVHEPFDQHCTSVITISYGMAEYSFVTDQWMMVTGGRLMKVTNPDKTFSTQFMESVNRFSSEARNAFGNYDDKFGVLPIVSETVLGLITNATFYPSQGGSFCNIISWATYPDGYYHTEAMSQGLAAALGTAAHFAIMQFDGSNVGKCDYYAYVGAGRLLIPEMAVIAAAVGSAIAIAIKTFELFWWALTAVSSKSSGYTRVVKALRHPLRFAFDTAEMFKGFIVENERDEDLCMGTLAALVSSFGGSRIQFGEDVNTIHRDAGHLRIGEYGKVCAIQPDRKYGTLPPPMNPELENLMEL